MRHKKHKTQFVICIKNKDYIASLELKKIYQVVLDEKASEYQQVRIVDESGEDYLYPEEYFIAVKLPQTVEKALLLAA